MIRKVLRSNIVTLVDFRDVLEDRIVKISFLSHIFNSCIIKKSNKKYLLELYLSLHPEDTGITDFSLRIMHSQIRFTDIAMP